MIKELEKYGYTEEKMKKLYNYDKNESDFISEFENVNFDKYV